MLQCYAGRQPVHDWLLLPKSGGAATVSATTNKVSADVDTSWSTSAAVSNVISRHFSGPRKRINFQSPVSVVACGFHVPQKGCVKVSVCVCLLHSQHGELSGELE